MKIELTFGNIPDSYDRLMNDGMRYLTPETSVVKRRIRRNYEKIRPILEELEKDEITYNQMKCRDSIQVDMKLSILRGYIYARTDFYRKDKETKDIRVIAGKTDIYGTDLNSLYNNTKFMKLAETKLKEKIDSIIEKS